MDYKKELENTMVEMEGKFGEKIELLEEYLTKRDKVAASKSLLETAKAEGLLSETIVGKNEQMREASARAVLINEYTFYENLKMELDELQIKYDVCSAEYDFIKEKSRILIALVQSNN